MIVIALTGTVYPFQTPSPEEAIAVMQPGDAQHMANMPAAHDEGHAGQSGAAIVEASPPPAPGTEQPEQLMGDASGEVPPSALGPSLVTTEVQVEDSGDGKAAADDTEAKGSVVTRRASSRKTARPAIFSPVAHETKAKRKAATAQGAVREGSSDPQLKSDGGLGAGDGGESLHDAAKDEEVRMEALPTSSDFPLTLLV